MRVQYYFAFYFIIFLNFLHQILSTNPSSKVLLEKMDKFHEVLKENIVKLDRKLNAISSKEKESFMLDHRFENAMFEKEEFTSKILKVKIELKEYLEEKMKFTNILNLMNNLKLENKKLKDLKILKQELINQRWLMLNFGRTVPADEYDPGHKIETILEHLELVKLLIEMHEFVNEFVDKMIAELEIHHNEIIVIRSIKGFLLTMEHQIKEHKRKMNKPFDDFVKKYSSKYFPKIEKFIKTTKEKLQTTFNEMTLPKEDLMPSQLREDRHKLLEAIFNPSNPLLQKVKLNAIKWIDPSSENVSKHFVKIAKFLEKEVDDFLNQFNGYFSIEQKHELSKLHVEWDDFLSLDIICEEMFHRIEPVIYDEKLSFIDKNINLADIHWLTELIEDKLAKMKGQSPIIKIPNMKIAMKMEELPEELELNAKNDPKNEAILIAQKMLSIAAQLDKLYNLKETANYTMLNKYEKFKEMIQKNLPSENIGQFFYQKYGEMKKGEEQKSSNGMEKIKIDEQHSNGIGFGKFGRK